jgi:hypothetical protein
MRLSAHLVEIVMNSTRRIADGDVMPRQLQAVGLAIRPEGGNAVAAPVVVIGLAGRVHDRRDAGQFPVLDVDRK